jgi:hypothetical protein
MSERPSGMAIGFTMFAAVVLLMIGGFQVMAGLSGIFQDDFYLSTPNYIFEFDSTLWGWFHLLWGVVLICAGLGLYAGAVWARTVGVVAALISAFANFAFIPVYPIWSILIIAVNVVVIWALTAHGRDIVADQ